MYNKNVIGMVLIALKSKRRKKMKKCLLLFLAMFFIAGQVWAVPFEGLSVDFMKSGDYTYISTQADLFPSQVTWGKYNNETGVLNTIKGMYFDGPGAYLLTYSSWFQFDDQAGIGDLHYGLNAGLFTTFYWKYLSPVHLSGFFGTAPAGWTPQGLISDSGGGGTSGGGNDWEGSGNGDTTVPAPVPEPGTFLLLGAGLIGLVLMKRKKNQPEQKQTAIA